MTGNMSPTGSLHNISNYTFCGDGKNVNLETLQVKIVQEQEYKI